jgi:hypothetical protein
MSGLPWWGWLMISGVCYSVQEMLKPDTEIDEEGLGKELFRNFLIGLTCLTALIALIRFVKLVWVG